SAWYVFSALGFYPVCPGTDQYVMGTPLFQKVTLKLDGGKTLLVQAPKNSEKTPYVSAVSLNGKPVAQNWLSHTELQRGGTLSFTMSASPNKQRGTTKASYPYSMSLENP
ncbi:MAG: glycoside hydrolase family 92 protein, partial [Chitinophagaceae bacterium]